MKKGSRIFAAALMIVGAVVMLFALASCGFDFSKLDMSERETNTYEIKEAFNNISFDANTEDIIISLTDCEYAVVICENEEVALSHSVAVKDGTLEIKIVDERKWYDYVNPVSYETTKLKVSLPAAEYGNLTISADTGDISIADGLNFKGIDVSLSTGDTECYASASDFIKIKASTGDINVDGARTGALELSANTGDVTVKNCTADSVALKTTSGKINASTLTVNGAFSSNVSTGKSSIVNVTCDSFASKGTTGKLKLENVIAASLMSIKRDTGDVELVGCDAGEIAIDTDTGDVKASLLTEKVFIVRTDTGKIRVPESITGEKCKITTDTGDITASVSKD